MAVLKFIFIEKQNIIRALNNEENNEHVSYFIWQKTYQEQAICSRLTADFCNFQSSNGFYIHRLA
jgi:hypothetical protein